MHMFAPPNPCVYTSRKHAISDTDTCSALASQEQYSPSYVEASINEFGEDWSLSLQAHRPRRPATHIFVIRA